jgi:hypothetical protein
MLKPTPRWRFGLVSAPGLLAAVALAALGSPVAVRADDELTKPYEFHIVLHVAEHRLLTDVFRERVGRELRDGLQEALGDLGRVTVAHDHPRLKDVLSRGLERSLDAWAERSGVKTHFVLIDYSGVHYEIQARQHDGLTGRAGRVVRHDRTRDRDFVAKTAAVLVAQDFGMVGTVLDNPDAQQRVRVELKAGGLGSLARWVRKGQVFEIVPPGSTAALDWALLRVEEPPAETARDGLCLCRLWHRYKLGSIAGHQCLLLGTTRAPLRLRFVQDRGQGVRVPLNESLGVDVRRAGFSGEDKTKLHKNMDPPGWLDTARDGERGLFEDAAFVSITNGLNPLPQIPVAILDDQPVIVPVRLTAGAGDLLASRRATWERNVSDSLMVQTSLFNEIQELIAKPDGRALALEKAKAGLKRTQADLEGLEAERRALADEAGAAFKPVREDQRIKVLRDGEGQLQRFVAEQEKIDLQVNDPKQKEWRSQVESARLLERDAEVGKAIAVYKRVLKEGLDSPELRMHVEQLEKAWKPIDDKHADARAFIYNVWPTLDTAGLKKHVEEAQKAFAECQRAKDVIAPLKLFKATEVHAGRLAKELDRLNPKINIDDEKPALLIKDVSEGLLKLAGEIQIYLQKAQPVGE